MQLQWHEYAASAVEFIIIIMLNTIMFKSALF